MSLIEDNLWTRLFHNNKKTLNEKRQKVITKTIYGYSEDEDNIMGTNDRKKSGKIFTGSKLIVDGQGNNGVLRNKSNRLNDILKKPNSDPDTGTPST